MTFRRFKRILSSCIFVVAVPSVYMTYCDAIFRPFVRTDQPYLGYADTYYVDDLPDGEYKYLSDSSNHRTVHAPEIHRHHFDVVVIGGGFAGLHTALRLGEKGQRVLVIEKGRVGSGASGMNGGQALAGVKMPNEEIEMRSNRETARSIYQQTLEGLERIREVVVKYKIDCDFISEGSLKVNRLPPLKSMEQRKEAATFQLSAYGRKIVPLDKNQTDAFAKSPKYYGGVLTPNGASVNPLALCLGLARAVKANGGCVAEMSEVLSVSSRQGTKEYPWVVQTKTYDYSGYVKARHVVCCTNAVPWWFSAWHSLQNIAIYSSILVTKPFPKGKLDEALTTYANVGDDRLSLAYFRKLPGDRLLWGGRCPYAYPQSYATLERVLKADLESSFPQLRGHVVPDKCWQGKMFVGYPPFPIVCQTDERGLWINAGHFGMGVVPTAAAGLAIADAILGDREKLNAWESVKAPWLPIVVPFKTLASQIVSTVSVMIDRWNERSL